MSKIVLFLIAGLVLIVLGGGAFLAAWDIPAPTQRVEKVIPNERLPR
ncbi:MAG: hypothetical protein KIT81_01150 [Alphaproteobacteria bacterium]|nr:hypothetical protein [Alphaproteobacteria bacterium]